MIGFHLLSHSQYVLQSLRAVISVALEITYFFLLFSILNVYEISFQ